MKNISFLILLFIFSLSPFAQHGDNSFGINRPVFIPVEKTILYKLSDKIIPIKVVQYGEMKDIVYINLHANETTSVQAAGSILETKGGTLIRIENNKQRVIRFRLKGFYYSFDPNRIFSRKGIEQTLRDNKRISKEAVEEIEKFAQRLLLIIPDTTSCIIALHNNTEGAFSIKSYLPGSDRQSDARAVYQNTLQDIDDIAFTTDSLLYQKMADYGYNSIWQDNERAKKDGSLSILCGEIKRRYINIETQHGKVNQYIKMLEKLLEILDTENKILPRGTPSGDLP